MQNASLPTTLDIVKCSCCSVSAYHLNTAFATQTGAGISSCHSPHTLIDRSCDQQSVSITHMLFETESKCCRRGNTEHSNSTSCLISSTVGTTAMAVPGKHSTNRRILEVYRTCQSCNLNWSHLCHFNMLSSDCQPGHGHQCSKPGTVVAP